MGLTLGLRGPGHEGDALLGREAGVVDADDGPHPPRLARERADAADDMPRGTVGAEARTQRLARTFTDGEGAHDGARAFVGDALEHPGDVLEDGLAGIAPEERPGQVDRDLGHPMARM